MTIGCRKISSVPVYAIPRIEKKKYLPAIHLFFIRDNLYPSPASSNSTPDKEVPSHANCTDIVLGVLGPFNRSKRALNDPKPPPSL